MKFTPMFVRKVNLGFTFMLALLLVGVLGTSTFVLASATSQFSQVISAGTLATDIVNASSSYTTVPSPAVAMSAKTFSFVCQSSTATFGSSTEAIYVQNPDASDSGWTLTLAATASTSVWDSVGTDFDFNDPTSSGCTDGTDADSLGGQMTVNPVSSGINKGACSSCTAANVSVGSSAAFNQETQVNTITLMTGAAGSDDIGDWTQQGVAITQWIPKEQPAASDYTLDLSLTITAV